MPNSVLDSNSKDINWQQGDPPATAPVITNPAVADPTGTTNVNAFGSSATADGYSAFQITTAGVQTTGALRTLTFNKPLDIVRPAVAAVSTPAGVAAGGAVTVTVTSTALTVSVGTALTTATTYQVYVRLL